MAIGPGGRCRGKGSEPQHPTNPSGFSPLDERHPFSRGPPGSRERNAGTPGGTKHGAMPRVRMLRPFGAGGAGMSPTPRASPWAGIPCPFGATATSRKVSAMIGRPGSGWYAPSGLGGRGCPPPPGLRPGLESHAPSGRDFPAFTLPGAHDAWGSSGTRRRSFSPIARSSLSGRDAMSCFSASVSFLNGGRRAFLRTFLGATFWSFR